MARNYLKEHCFHFGLDFLVLYGTFRFEDIFSSINITNSHYGELGDLIYNKRSAGRSYQYCIDFNYKGYNVFSYVKGKDDIQIPTYDCVTFYGVAFRLLNIEEIDYYIQAYFDIKKVKRFDICIDLVDPIEKILKKFRSPTEKGKIYLGEKGRIEGRGIGVYDQSKNRRSFIRIYDKIQDIKDSRKGRLYSDYLQKNHVTRIELEIRRELAKNIEYTELYNPEILKSIFCNYLRKHTEIFKDLSEEKITLYRKPKKLSSEEMQTIYYKQLFRKNFLGYAKRILEGGACPIRILMSESVYLNSTKKRLGEEKFNRVKLEEESLRKKAYCANPPKKEFKNEEE